MPTFQILAKSLLCTLKRCPPYREFWYRKIWETWFGRDQPTIFALERCPPYSGVRFEIVDCTLFTKYSWNSLQWPPWSRINWLLYRSGHYRELAIVERWLLCTSCSKVSIRVKLQSTIYGVWIGAWLGQKILAVIKGWLFIVKVKPYWPWEGLGGGG